MDVPINHPYWTDADVLVNDTRWIETMKFDLRHDQLSDGVKELQVLIDAATLLTGMRCRIYPKRVRRYKKIH